MYKMFNIKVALLEYDGEDGFGLYPFDINSLYFVKRIVSVKRRCKALTNYESLHAILLENGDITFFYDDKCANNRIPILEASKFSICDISVYRYTKRFYGQAIILCGIDIDQVVHRWFFCGVQWTYCSAQNNFLDNNDYFKQSKEMCYKKIILSRIPNVKQHILVNNNQRLLYVLTNEITGNTLKIYSLSLIENLENNAENIDLSEIEVKYDDSNAHNFVKITPLCAQSSDAFVVLNDGSALELFSNFRISIPNEDVNEVCNHKFYFQGDQCNKIVVSTTNGNIYHTLHIGDGNPTNFEQVCHSDNGSDLIPANVGSVKSKIKSARSTHKI